jgi:LysR family transcriptional regulator for bpeEF and oprC
LDHLDRMRLFNRVVESGSFTDAGKAAGVAQSTVSKEMATLEARLGTQLVRRSPRGMTVTDAGQQLYDTSLRILADLDAAEALIRAGHDKPAGRIRVAAPAVMSSRLIAPNMGQFMARFPDLSIDMDVSERYVSLIEEGIDVAIRIGSLSDSGLIARQIGALQPVVVASPSYLAAHGTPKTPADLEQHDCLPYLFEGASRQWRFRGLHVPFNIAPRSRFRTNDAASVHAAALAGLGLAQGPTWLFRDDLNAGRLRAVLVEFRGDAVPVHAVTSAGRKSTARTRAFIAFMGECMARDPELGLP